MSGFTMNNLSSVRMCAPDHVIPMAAVHLAIIASLKMQAY